MPIQIDCHNALCTDGYIFYNDTKYKCPECKDGKLTVYTEAEMKEEREEVIKMIANYIDDDNYSLTQLFRAIRARGDK